MTYFIATYGCQMNVHESEKIAGVLESMGYTLAEDIQKADIVVFNTCAIRESAEQKILGNIGALKPIKAKRKDMLIVVCGCMSQQEAMAGVLKEKYPFVDIVLGTHNLASLRKFIEQKIAQKKRVFAIEEQQDIAPRDAMPMVRTSGVNAWVNIMYGCNNFCTYCIVPYVRGREISRPMQDIVKEVCQLLKEGYKEITLLGQNVNSYGNGKEETFAKLLQTLDALPYKYRLKFMTSHPKDLSMEVVDVISKGKNIAKCVHLPIQSGSNRILEAMNRKYTVEHYVSIIDALREKVPGVTFSTDMIVGFPGETDEDFALTLDVIKRVQYQQVFAFMYSRRKGTVADKMDGQIPLDVKKQRLQTLLAVEKEISEKLALEHVGEVEEVLLEDVHPKLANKLMGSTVYGRAVTVQGAGRVGDFVKVKITKVKNSVLFGDIVEDEYGYFANDATLFKNKRTS